MAAVAAALAVAAGGWFALKGNEGPVSVAVPRSAAVVTPSVASPAPQPQVEAQPVVRTIVSDPTGASVVLDGNTLGTTPYALALPARSGAALELRADGYRPLHHTVAPDAPSEIRVTLEKLPNQGKTPRAPAPAAPARPKLAPR